MANFMGPMAPPQAAPPQPQKLDIRTSPGQRQQFKDFMRQRTAMMPMTSAPIAPPPMMPMMPQMPPQMPLRMEMGGDVDIFEPQNYHEGGLVNTLGKLGTMSNQMVDALNTVVMGGGTGGGMDMGMGMGGMSGGFGMPSLSALQNVISVDPQPPQRPISGAPVSPKADNTRLLGSGDKIDQGFLNSPEFKALDFTGPATMDMYISPYFGQIGSGSQGKAQDAAYEAYLERIGGGNKAPAGTPTAPMQPAPNLFSGTIEPTSYGLAGMGTTLSFENGGSVPSFYTLFKPGQGGDSGEVNKIFIGSKQDTAAARQKAKSGQTAPNPTDNLGVISGAGIDPYDVRMARLAQDAGSGSSGSSASDEPMILGGIPTSPPLGGTITNNPSDVIVPSSRPQVELGNFPMPVQPNYPFPITPDIQAGLNSIAPVGLGLPANLLGDLSGGPLKFDDGGAVPPRNTNIGGQPHMLSYITPDEADILQALGGSGELGPMGIPAFPPDSQSGPGANVGPDNGGGSDDGPDFGMSPGQSQAQFGTTEFAGMSEQDAKDTLAGGGGSEKAKAVQANLAAQAAAEAAAKARVEAAKQAAAAKARQDAIDRARDRVQAGLADQQAVDSMAAGSLLGSAAPAETNISATPGTSPSDSFGIESTDMTTDKYAEEAANLLGLADDLLAIPDDLVETRPGKTPVDDVDDTPEVLGMDDEYDTFVGTPDYTKDRPGYKDGLPTGLEFAETSKGKFTTNLAGLTAEQKAALPGYMNPTENTGLVPGIMNMIGLDPVQDVYGYEFDDTGKVTGVVGPGLGIPGPIGAGLSLLSDIFGTPPETTEDLLNQGVYTGFGEGSKIGGPEESGADQPVVKLPNDPCPEGFALKDGVCTPIAPTGDSGGSLGNLPSGPTMPTGPVIVPSSRPPITNTLQGPVGYGMPTAGQINPFAVSSAAQYQQMLNQQAMNPPQFAPIKFQDGGTVSSNLDRAADNFLQSLMPAA